jgi:acyl-CoA thioesterase-1
MKWQLSIGALLSGIACANSKYDGVPNEIRPTLEHVQQPAAIGLGAVLWAPFSARPAPARPISSQAIGRAANQQGYGEKHERIGLVCYSSIKEANMDGRKILTTASFLLMVCGVSFVQAELFGHTQQSPSPQQAPHPAFSEIEDNPALPRVLLIGDSISIGYTLPTRALLQDIANVHRIPVNGGPTTYGLKNLDQWLGNGKWHVIHFNWGLHDLRLMDDGKHQVSIESYEKNLTDLVARLKRTGATLIWASTTPVPDAELTPPRKDSDVIAYNLAARRTMEESGIKINDLYAVALPRLHEIQRPANVHYTDAGSEVLAERVAASIRAVLDAHR